LDAERGEQLDQGGHGCSPTAVAQVVAVQIEEGRTGMHDAESAACCRASYMVLARDQG